jgi:DNA-binding SARP family transcriptional activator
LARACSCIPGREREAVAAARRTTSLAPFRESGDSLLMRALVAEGNPAEALLVYERWRELLRDELGIAPSLAMSALDVWALEQAAPEQAAAWASRGAGA